MSPASIVCPCCDGANARAKAAFDGRWVPDCLVCEDDGEITFKRAEHEDLDRPYFPLAWRIALGWAESELSIAAE